VVLNSCLVRNIYFIPKVPVVMRFHIVFGGVID